MSKTITGPETSWATTSSVGDTLTVSNIKQAMDQFSTTTYPWATITTAGASYTYFPYSNGVGTTGTTYSGGASGVSGNVVFKNNGMYGVDGAYKMPVRKNKENILEKMIDSLYA